MQLEAGLLAGGPHPVTASPRPSHSAHQSVATSVLGRGGPGAVGTHVPWGERLSMPPAPCAGQGGTWGKAGTPGLGAAHWDPEPPRGPGPQDWVLLTGTRGLPVAWAITISWSPLFTDPVPGGQTGRPKAVAGQELWSQPPRAGGCSGALTGLDCPFVEARGGWARACRRADPTSSCGTTSESGDPPAQCQEAQGRAGTTPLGSGESQ